MTSREQPIVAERDGAASAAGRARPSRERILDAAESLFAERGYADTTTKLVATTAGVSTGLVFYHFESKQDLLESLLRERTFGPELEELLAAADPGDVRGTLRDVGGRLHLLLSRRRSLVGIMLQLAARGGGADGPARLLGDLLRAELDRLAGWLVAAHGDGVLDRHRAAVAAQGLLSSVLTSVALVGPPDGMDPSDFLAATVDVLVDGLVDGLVDKPGGRPRPGSPAPS